MRPHNSFVARHVYLICVSLCLFCLGHLGAQEVGGFKYLEVKVVDPDGKPVADVPVDINIDGVEFPMPTNKEGMVSVNVPTAENSEVEVDVRHEGYAAMAVAWDGGKKIPDNVTIRMQKGVSFGGIIHDEEGKPIEGVMVKGIMVFDKRRGYPTNGSVVPFLDGDLATTDKQGRWKCSMAPEGSVEFQLKFMHPEFLLSEDSSGERSETWAELKGMERIVVLEKGLSLTGRILGPDGHPVPRAFVELIASDDDQRRGSQTFSNGEGRFETHPVPPGIVTLSVVAPKFAPLMTKIDDTKSNEPLSLRLDRGRLVQIKVVNNEGKPLAGTQVSVTDWHYTGNTLDLGDNHPADDQGRWQWEHAPKGEMTYLFSLSGYMEAKHSLLPSDQWQTITLEPAVKITGNVIDKVTREPIKKFRLMQIAWLDCGEGCNSVIAYGNIEVATPGDYVFQTGLLCKESKLVCTAEGYKNASSRIIHPDERTITYDFELDREQVVSSDVP